jgi:hypothetical protein
VIPATQEAETGGSQFESFLGKKALDPIWKTIQTKRTGSLVSSGRALGAYDALGSSPSIAKINK